MTRVTEPRIAVLGAGANGASIGADLVQAGADVTLIEQWPEHARAMREHGVTVITPHRSDVTPVTVVDLCDVARERGTFDVILMLMKAYDSRWAAELVRPVLAEDGILVGVQNGITIDAVSAAVGEHRTMGCVIEITSMIREPGVIERHSDRDRSWFAVGAVQPDPRGREAEIARILGFSGTVQVVDDILSAKWMKLVSNATTLAITAIVDQPMRAAGADPRTREMMLAAGREALAVARAGGHSVLPIFGLRREDVAQGDVVERLLDHLLAGFVLPSSTTTVRHDWRHGRRSEVGDINGHVVSEGERLGVPTPVNRAIVETAAEIEAGAREPDPALLTALSERAAAARVQ